jgi:hypothetical protein
VNENSNQQAPNPRAKTPITKIQTPKKSQCSNPNFSSDVGGFELEPWSFSGVWNLVFDVWLVGRGICQLPPRKS